MRNVTWIRNDMVYLWIQERPQEGHNNNNKGARTELLQQVGVLYLHFLRNVDFANLFNSWSLYPWAKLKRERIKWNRWESKMDLSTWLI